MIKNKAIAGLLMMAMFASWSPASQIVNNWYWVPVGTGLNNGRTVTFHDPANEVHWHTDPAGATDVPGAGTGVVLSRLTAAAPDTAFWAIPNQGTSYGIRLRWVTTADSTQLNVTAPFTYVGPLLSTAQDTALPLMNSFNFVMEWGDNDGGPTINVNFSDLRFQGTMRGFRPNNARLGGNVTLTGPTAISMRSGQTWFLDAEVDASAIDEIRIQHYERDTAGTNMSNIRLNPSRMWFSGTWVLDAQVWGDRAGAFGDADIIIHGAGTPVRITDRRSGRLQVNVANSVASTARLSIDTTSHNPNLPFSAASPQNPGGRVFVAPAASPMTIRELWVDGVQMPAGEYFSTATANHSWFGTVTGGSRIIVTGTPTRNLTMAAVDAAGIPLPVPSTYPRAGLTRAFAQGYVLTIRALNTIVAPDDTTHTFSHWTSSVPGAVADVSAASTTVTIPTTSNITVTAHYTRLAATSPMPMAGATNVSVFTGLSWVPAAGATQQVYFGTQNPPVNLVAQGVGVSSVSNAALGGPLAANTQYFWRVHTNGSGGPLWQFTTGSPKAHNPSPANGAIEINPSVLTLAWAADSASVLSYDVYISTDEAAVASGTAPKTVVSSSSLAIDGALARGTRYFWRVDSNYAGGLTIVGDVWSFRTTTYKLYLRTDIPAFSVDGAADVNAVVFGDDPNMVLYSFESFNYGSDWDIIVSGRRAVAIWSDKGITFGGRLNVSGADGRVAGSGAGAGIGIAGGFDGGHNSQAAYTVAIHGPGHGATSADMRVGGGGGHGGDGGRCGRYSSVAGGAGGLAYGQTELYVLMGGSGGGGGGRAGGGAGGGVVEFFAQAGNIDILPTAVISSDGGSNDFQSAYPGGGGAGGSIRLIASGNVNIAGAVTADGGHGGSTPSMDEAADTGGGGGGGRIAIYTGGTFSNTGTITAIGGMHGFDGSVPPISLARPGGDGSIYTAGRVSTLLAAHNPIPANGDMLWVADANQLSWMPALGSVENKLYFGTSPASLTLQTTFTNPNGMRSQKVHPVALVAGRKYYWRVDTEGVMGPLWSFGTGVCTSPAGDVNGDCKVTFVDFALVAADWNVCNLLPQTICNP